MMMETYLNLFCNFSSSPLPGKSCSYGTWTSGVSIVLLCSCMSVDSGERYNSPVTISPCLSARECSCTRGPGRWDRSRLPDFAGADPASVVQPDVAHAPGVVLGGDGGSRRHEVGLDDLDVLLARIGVAFRRAFVIVERHARGDDVDEREAVCASARLSGSARAAPCRPRICGRRTSRRASARAGSRRSPPRLASPFLLSEPGSADAENCPFVRP